MLFGTPGRGYPSMYCWCVTAASSSVCSPFGHTGCTIFRSSMTRLCYVSTDRSQSGHNPRPVCPALGGPFIYHFLESLATFRLPVGFRLGAVGFAGTGFLLGMPFFPIISLLSPILPFFNRLIRMLLLIQGILAWIGQCIGNKCVN